MRMTGSRALNRACDFRAKELMRQRNVRCNLGGCAHHSGHEICSVDSAYENYFDEARDELGENSEHAEYNRDACLAAADVARLKYRTGKKFEDFKEWKNNIRQAWRMRAVFVEFKRSLK